mmetsp:Transcript_21636/g.77051  ORF Transcript_21636/g.77051 Transcript_21636/m.77051 type:complete len:290 (+) Transcript_21636:437-1306(+)
MAAISALADTSTRRRRLRLAGGYHGTHLAKTALLQSVDSAPLGDPSTLEPGDIVWLETPKNPDASLTDIAAYVGAAALLEECHVVVDSTFAPPPLQTPLATFGVVMVMHSASKALSGHSDVLAGVVLTRKDDGALLEAVRRYRVAAGAVLGSLETWLLLRSLRTLDLRVRRQSETALAVATFLHVHPLVAKVHHAALQQPELCARQMPHGAGGIFAIECSSEAAAKGLPEALKLFRAATSIGGVESLAEWRHKYDAHVSPTLVRLSVGLEDPGDLMQDLDEALHRLEKA